MSTNTNLVALKNLAREIANNWETIDLLEGQAKANLMEFIRELALQGQRLQHAKTHQTKHGQWLPWCEFNCAVPYWKINRAMVVAANLTRIENSEGLESMRQVLALCRQPTDDPKTPAAPKRQWVPAIEANLKLSKVVGYEDRFPFEKWRVESQDAFRETLEPLARKAWPSKFA